MPPKRVIIVRCVFILLCLWSCWFLYQLARPGTDIAGEMMAKFSRAIDSSYESSRLVYTATIAVALCAYNWIDLILPFVVDLASLIKTAIGPLWTLMSPLILWIARRTLAGIHYVNDTLPLKYKVGGSMIVFIFFRVARFSKIFILNLMFFIFTFDFTKMVLVNNMVRVVLFVLLPVVLSLVEISRRTQSVRSLNLIVYLTLLPLGVAIESWSGFEAFSQSKYALFYFCPLWAGLVSLLMCLNTPIRLAGWGVDWLLDDLGVSALIRKGLIPLIYRVSEKVVTKYPMLKNVPDKFASIQSKIVTIGLNLSTGRGLSLSSLVRGRWTLVALVLISIIIIGYFAYTALTLFVSVAVWPWFFMESFKVMNLEISSEYRGQLSFTLLFLGYEFLLVRSNFVLVAFFASMLHLPALLVLKVASGILIGQFIDVIKPRFLVSPQPSPQPSPKKDD
jgi:hypothetical protein